MRRLSLALFIGALAVGCDKSPSTPTPPAGSPTPTPTPQAALSGLVRDRDTNGPSRERAGGDCRSGLRIPDGESRSHGCHWTVQFFRHLRQPVLPRLEGWL